MSNYTLLVYTKNKNSLINFINFFEENLKQTFVKVSMGKKLKKTVSVLKSPHVNKTAQEHFKYVHFYVKLQITTFELKKKLLVLKKIKNKLFPDVKIVIKGNYKKKYSNYKNNFFNYNQNVLIGTQTSIISSELNYYFLKKVFQNLKVLDSNGHIKN
jgi:ribosomal protein S10